MEEEKKRSKRKKLFIWLAVAMFVITVLAIVLPIVFGGDDTIENEFVRVTNVEITSGDFVQTVRMYVENKTDEQLTVRLRYMTWTNNWTEININFIVNAGQNIPISHGINTVFDIDRLQIMVEGQHLDVYNGSFSIIGLLFFIPFLIFFAFIILAFVGGAKRLGVTFSMLNGRMIDIDGRIARCNNEQEMQRLREEKQRLQSEMNQFVECEFCGTRNRRNEQQRCSGCGAPVR